MWIGLDDTDSPRGGCTTHVLTELVRAARSERIDLLGLPRLVRLNPNAPWKTRGNAALAARFGHGIGRARSIGSIDGQAVRAFGRGRELSDRAGRDWVERAWEVVRAGSRLGEPGTDPAMVAARRPLPADLYWEAVRRWVAVESVRDRGERLGAEVRFVGDPRGVVGASAAIAWPGRRRSYEAIAYRRPDLLGRPRTVERASVERAQRRFPSLFLCTDPRTRRLLIAPHTPCPILFGLRAMRATDAVRALPTLRSEPIDRWLLFATNQGTGDHIVELPFPEAAVGMTVALEGTVAGAAAVLAGGHARFPLTAHDGSRVPCIAFEPTKILPRLAQRLVVGDRLRVWGSVSEDRSVRLEGIQVRAWVRRLPRRGAPRCSACRRGARSLGRLRGYRCPGCGRRWPPEAGAWRARVPPAPRGTYHPTPSARRHLAPRGPEPRVRSLAASAV